MALYESGVWLTGSDMGEERLVELEKKVGLVMRSLDLLLFKDGEMVSEEAAEELRIRLRDYLEGRTSEFVEIGELNVQDIDSQEGSEGDSKPSKQG